MTFSVGAPEKDGTRQATLNLTFFKKADEGKAPPIQRRINVTGFGTDGQQAQNQALEYALNLLGV
jgi:hypothetical protein